MLAGNVSKAVINALGDEFKNPYDTKTALLQLTKATIR